MATILCSISGIEYTCEHFPITLRSRETYHPIFDVPQRQLFPYLRKWSSNELTPTDSYLLFLALLKSTDLVQFRVPVFRTAFTPSIIANNMEFLAKAVYHINQVSTPAHIFPHYAISSDTKDLSNIRYWIQNWEDSYAEFLAGSRRGVDDRVTWQKLDASTRALERLIKNPYRSVSEYASNLAEWAADAGSFPTFMLESPLNKLPISCADYWKHIIVRSTKDLSIFVVPKKDMDELLEHCEEHIPAGSIYSNALFKLLRSAIDRRKTFISLGDLDVKSTYAILGESDSVERANLAAAVQAAPDHEPKRDEYPSKFEFIKAMMRWKAAQGSNQ